VRDEEVVQRLRALSPRERCSALPRLVREYYEKRLNLPLSHEAAHALAEHAVVEASHGAQLGHIGIHRLYLKGAELARRAGRAVMLFLVGDQYQPAMYPEINRVYFPKCGKKGAPFVLPINKQDRRKPLYMIPPPAEKSILRLRNQILGLFGPNLHHFCVANGIDKRQVDRSFFKQNLEHVVEVLLDCSEKTGNYADWAVRCQVQLLGEVFPELFTEHVVFFPISMLHHLPEFMQLAERVEEINRCKLRVSARQRRQGRVPYLSKEIPLNLSPFWYHCPECSSRNRGVIDGGKARYTCTTCGAEVVQGIEEGFSNPDIVFSQVLTPLSLGTSVRVVGHLHPYAEVADEFLGMIGVSPPERLVLDTAPVFHGLGDSEAGDPRCSLLRALLEAERESLRRLVTEDWGACPRIYSRYHAYTGAEAGGE